MDGRYFSTLKVKFSGFIYVCFLHIIKYEVLRYEKLKIKKLKKKLHDPSNSVS
jgi:hypothetical protein